jgi:hypothetical protein
LSSTNDKTGIFEKINNSMKHLQTFEKFYDLNDDISAADTNESFDKITINSSHPIQIIKSLNRDKTTIYTLNKDNSIDVEGNVVLSAAFKLTKMPVKFGKINGNFNCSENKLTSLKHGPITVTGDFSCVYNDLTSLEHCPTTILGSFYCYRNQLTSLEHCPTTIVDFNCSYNLLTSLEHCPTTILADFDCSNNLLTSLKYVPTRVLDFDCSNNLLTSLEHGPKTVAGSFDFAINKFPENIQEKIDNFKGNWQELLHLMNIWQSKKLNDLDNKTGLFN